MARKILLFLIPFSRMSEALGARRIPVAATRGLPPSDREVPEFALLIRQKHFGFAQVWLLVYLHRF